MSTTPSKSATERYGAVFAAVAAMEQEASTFGDEVRVVFLRNITIEGADTLLKYHLLSQRIRPVIAWGGYGTMAQDVLDPAGPVARTDPDLIVLALSLEELDPKFGQPGWTADVARDSLLELFEILMAQTRATVAVNNFIGPLYPELGLVVDPHGADISAQVALLNAFVSNFVRVHAPRFCLMDWERYLRLLGAEQALDRRGQYLWRAPLRRPFLDAHAQQLARVVFALKGRAKKVLVLDCDNTLWGGVIGEDGIAGIQLDDNQYPGKAFVDFQTSVLHLAERGVLIVLCSKNEEADVFEVLDGHPACRIKRSHLAGWRIDWNDKASNLMQLAEELNLGLDAFVFIDDNPVECELVRQVLPQVTVLQVPQRLHELPYLPLREGLFDTLRLTAEDKHRARLYQGEAQRKSVRSACADIDEYLKSMQSVAVIARDQARDVPRIAQLTQKTNQFNLTTRRYSEQDIAAFIDDPDVAVFSLTVNDRFGTLGLVGVLVVKIHGAVGRVDTFLMSCRALGRRLEQAMLVDCLVALGRERQITEWEAAYVPTRKNAQVAEFWDKLGFARSDCADGSTRYHRPSQPELSITNAHLEIERT